ncbi:MAG: SUMF1/EgtB/PvdO family nonheme iron enzyme [Deltaproteobacteria bacterium]|nr:SUMF1/EgtB/PvdO family nonheme iron enzyme [Deltaproteobacteria bacterium]
MRRNHGMHTTLALVSALAALAATGCSTEPYCVGSQCFVNDSADDTADATDTDTAGEADEALDAEADEAETGGETTEGGDDDGDGDAGADADAACDEATDFLNDPANCGGCGIRCRPTRAFGACVDGVCVIDVCELNFGDCNGLYDDGCEDYCVPRVSGPCDPATCSGSGCDSSCNRRDDDCNCTPDDCVDMTSDPDNCGDCGIRCLYPNADGVCTDSACEMGACHCGYWDVNLSPVDGCEYECGPADCSTPPAETCNSLDDDCDGTIDQGDPGGGGPCGTAEGECELGVERCVAGRVECVGSHAPVPESCNDLDDDCDGATDEDDPEGGVACGLTTGECEQGLTHCVAGTVECSGAVEPTLEACNGRDDDCDGAIDDSPAVTILCTPPPLGICVAGTPVCIGGVEVCDGAAPGEPERCDGLDNDCNGSTDEGLSRSCGSDIGDCVAGTETCAGGTWGACTGATGPATETCNGRDDDCNGVTDQMTRSCGSDTGECSFGSQLCVTGAWGACNGGVTARTEVCDGLDNDCDGATDEGNPGGGAACGMDTGECSPGTVTCVSGALSCSGGTGPVAESCNNRDDDCDGATDDGNPGGGASCYTGPAGTSGRGICRPGVLQCSAGTLSCVGQTLPGTETCDGVDEDCDGTPDDGDPGGGAACGTGVGECVTGVNRCTGGAIQCTGGTGPVAETCNNRDDDCDAATDEGNPGGGAACGSGIGECVQGTTQCTAGTLDCVGDVTAVAETCNGRDDDCDGTVDNSPTLTITCSPPPVGICTAGTPSCVGGTQVCAGEVPGVPETCNTIDDDCDTLTDEDFNLSIDPNNCGTCGNVCNLPQVASNVCIGGICRVGACAGGWWDVNGTAADGCEYACTYNGAETCNAIDDDCDRLTDAADPDLPTTRPSAATFCANTGSCVGATVQCGLMGGTTRWYCQYPPAVSVDASGNILPETRCNTLDEDCDGSTDENWPGVRHSGIDLADPCSAGVGFCLRNGSYVCTGDGLGQVCSATAGAPGTESCNGIDDDCDGSTDDLAETDYTAWGAVQVSGSVDTNRPRDGTRETARTFYVMRWEASRPDATSASAGTINNQKVCSRTGVLPWTTVSWTDANAACCRMNSDGVCHTSGGFPSRWSLCRNVDWELSCERYTTGYYLYPYGATYVAATCNGNDYDTSGAAGDQDDILSTGTMASCRNTPSFPPSASWIYDASGNVKEWTWTSRVIGGVTYYEIRGGASNNAAGGLTCPFDFTLGTASFSFPNLGFRCCYY